MDGGHDADAPVSKEAFSLLCMSKMAAFGMDIKVYRHGQVLNGGRLPSSEIREYVSTLYVGLARTVPPTNTNFWLSFLLTRLQEALYEDLPV